jgi:DNA repair protein RadD
MLFSKPLELKTAQKQIVNACRQTMATHKRMVLMAATGLGKTIIAVWMIRQAMRKDLRILFICDRVNLVEQTSAVFSEYGINHGIIMSDHSGYAPGLRVQIASAQTLARRKIHEFDFIIIDECHTWHKAHKNVLKMNPEAFVLGLSATPFSKGLGKYFDTHVEPVPMRQLINDEYLCDFEIYGPDTIDLTKVRTRAGEYREDDLAEATDKPTLVADVVDTWFKLARGRKTIIFCTNVAHGRHLAQEFCKRGVKAAEINGYMAKGGEDGRDQILDGFISGDTQVMCSVEILIKGFNVTSVDCIVWATATKSPTKWIQGCGRGLRLHSGKDICRILDHGSNAERLGFPDEFEFLKLDDGQGQKGQGQQNQERQQRLPQKCPSCDFLKPAGVRKCPACQFTPEFVQDVEVEDRELKKLKRKVRREYSLQEKQSFLAQLNQYAADKGFKQGKKGCFGWALHKYKEKFGSDVSSRLDWGTREQIGSEVRNFITHLHIKYGHCRKMG